MRFLELSVENFGPYYQKTTVTFDPDKNGVTIFWGNNGRGKTTLLNAFRYALYGEIKKRNNNEVKYYEMINKIGSQEGKNYFVITLKIADSGDIFELTRKYSLRSSFTHYSEHSEDYEAQTFLRKNNSILSKSESDKYIANLLPKDISRFFLFDGELLQEYESLLEDGNDAGEKIKNSIEKILGLPYLANSLTDCKSYLSIIDSQKKKAVQASDKSSKLSAAYNALCEEIETHKKAILDSKDDLEKLKNEKLDIEQDMSETEQARKWLNEISNQERIIEEKKKAIDNLKILMKTFTKEAWKYQIRSKLEELKTDIENTIESFKSKETKHQIDSNLIKMLEETVHSCECTLCSQKINNEIISKLNKQVEDLSNESNSNLLTDDEKQQMVLLQNRLAIFNKNAVANYDDDIKTNESSIEKYKVEINDANNAIQNLKAKLDGLDFDVEKQSSNILSYPKRLSDCEVKISNLKSAIDDEEKKTNELISNRDDLWKQINKIGRKDLDAITKKSDLTNDICKIFEQAIDLFRSNLKKNVEKDATELFKKLSAEKDYEKLSINDSYGLSIINSSGVEAPNRSAGYEHIVALSLIGALHKNAPLKGPIIMDSPFGRLDPENKRNMCSVLPDLADQVILLMYDDEIDSELIRDILKSNLIVEHNLVRVESMNTRID